MTPPHAPQPLTAREQQMARHIALGHTNCEIARELSISVRTVEIHVANLLIKLPARNRGRIFSQLLGEARTLRLVDLALAAREKDRIS